jgi:hypothetical protein
LTNVLKKLSQPILDLVASRCLLSRRKCSYRRGIKDA